MWQNLTTLAVSPLNLVIRGAVVYFAVLLLLRVSGKRQIGQMGATEFVAILLISNAVQNAMNAGDNSLLGGLILAVVLIAASSAITYLTYRSRRFERIFEGTPTLLIHKGNLIQPHLDKERLTLKELKVLMRKQGVEHLADVNSAILEADGSLSITKNSEINR